MSRAWIYIVHIVVTAMVLYIVKVYCEHNQFYNTRPILLTLLGMNMLLGVIVLKGLTKRILIASGIISVILLGVYLIHDIVFLGGIVPTNSMFGFPGLIFFAATVGFYELALELRERGVW